MNAREPIVRFGACTEAGKNFLEEANERVWIFRVEKDLGASSESGPNGRPQAYRCAGSAPIDGWFRSDRSAGGRAAAPAAYASPGDIAGLRGADLAQKFENRILQ
jgi:hypothetical protein